MVVAVAVDTALDQALKVVSEDNTHLKVTAPVVAVVADIQVQVEEMDLVDVF